MSSRSALTLTMTISRENVHLSNTFAFKLFRTLLRNGALSTPLLSITSALFTMQRRGGPSNEDLLSHFAHFRRMLSFLFSSDSALPILEALCFDILTNCPGGGYPRQSSFSWLPATPGNRILASCNQRIRGPVSTQGFFLWLWVHALSALLEPFRGRIVWLSGRIIFIYNG